MRNSKRNRLGDVIRVFGLLALLLSGITLLGGTKEAQAQDDESYTNLTSLMIGCSDGPYSPVIAEWDTNGFIQFTLTTVSNTSDSWTSSEIKTQFGLWPQVELRPFDKVIIEANLYGGARYKFFVDVGLCDTPGTIQHMEYTPPPVLTLLDWTCDGAITAQINPVPSGPTTITVYSEPGDHYGWEDFDFPVTTDGIFSMQSTLTGYPYYISASVDDGRYWSGIADFYGECERPAPPTPDFPFAINNLVLNCESGETTFSYLAETDLHIRVMYFFYLEGWGSGYKWPVFDDTVPASGELRMGTGQAVDDSLQFVGIFVGQSSDNLFSVASINGTDCTTFEVPDDASFTLLSAVRACEDQQFTATWSGNAVTKVEFSLTNTSDSWTTGWLEADAASGTFTTPVDHHGYDKAVARAIFANGAVQTEYASVTPCDISSVPPETPEAPFMTVVGVKAVCEGTVTVSLETNFTGTVAIKLFLANGSDPVRFNHEVDGSGDYDFVFPQLSADHFPAEYWIVFGNPEVTASNGRGTIEQVCPVEPEVPGTVVPTEAPGTEIPATQTPVVTGTPTATAPSAGSTVTITLLLPNQDSLEGAPWSLYAELASLQAMAPYATGVVGPNNTIVIHDVPDGRYRLVISPEGREALSFDLTVAVGADGTQDIVLDLAESTATATATATSTATPDEKESEVTGLPSTGAGMSNAPVWFGLAAFSAMVIAAAGTVGLRGRR